MSANNLPQKLKTSHTALSTKPLPKRNIFPFTSLPAELRNQIYALALTDANTIFLISKTKRYRRTVERLSPGGKLLVYRVDGFHFDPPEPLKLPTLAPNLLLLNQAIYAETQPILYAGNTFAVEDTMAMHTFLATIGPKNRATISDLTIGGWGHTKAHKALNYPAFAMLAGAVNLTRLNINCEIGWNYGPTRQARQLYRDGFRWFEAVGVEKGRFDAVLDVIKIEDRVLIGSPYGRKKDFLKRAEEKQEEFKAELRRLLSLEKLGGGGGRGKV